MAYKAVLNARASMAAGSIIWIAAFQYFIIEHLAQLAWGPGRYSYRFNTISDLGATVCDAIPQVDCSSLHALMNASFIASSVITISGMYFLRNVFPSGRGVRAGLAMIAAGSLGAIGVGLFPENENATLHFMSAADHFLFSNIGLLVLGIYLKRAGWNVRYARMTSAVGSIGLIALACLPLAMPPLGGVGVVERMVAYPITIWTIATGILLLQKRERTDRNLQP